jgi:asparagine synthetase B (glutamine-hydrolysing)
MNILTCKVNQPNTQHKKVKTRNQFNNGTIDLKVNRIHTFDFDQHNYYFNEISQILCAMTGYISNLDYICSKYDISEKCDVKILSKLFRLRGINVIAELEGLFSLFVWDDLVKKIYVFQDVYGSNLPLYYSHTSKAFTFGTSLKSLLPELGFKREFNSEIIYDFLFQANIIPSKSTLIKNVLKLTPGNYICINLSGFTYEIKPMVKIEKQTDLHTAKRDILTTVEENFLGLLRHLTYKDTSLTLSSGYDTNLLLCLLSNSTTNNINAFTISGKLIDEAPDVRQILSHYSDVKHHTTTISKNILYSFPDIIWKLEGYVFHSGIFLQYELAKLICNEKINYIFLGECADQVLDHCRNSPTIFRRAKYLLQASFIGSLLYNLFKVEQPEIVSQVQLSKHFKRSKLGKEYDIALDFILKKNGIMLNSFGIQGVYPFINSETASMGKALKTLNRKKQFYIQKVRELLGNDLIRHIGKARGGTDTIFLFNSEIQKFALSVCKSSFIRSLLPQAVIQEILHKPCYYNVFILKLLYLDLFNKIFISGKFDSQFSNPHLNNSLLEF